MTVDKRLHNLGLSMIDTLEKTDPAGMEFGQTLENLERLLGIKQFVAEVLDTESAADEHPVDNIIAFEPVAPAPAPEPVPVPEPEPEPEPEPAPAATYSKEEVRAKLGAARKKGVNINELLQKFGVDRFTALPEDRYEALMKELG